MPKTHFDVFAIDNLREDDPIVPTHGAFSFSRPQGGCGNPDCKKTACPPGHWFTLMLPLNEAGTVYGDTLQFEDREDLINFFTNLQNIIHLYLKAL